LRIRPRRMIRIKIPSLPEIEQNHFSRLER
jgi:hypothetical protein